MGDTDEYGSISELVSVRGARGGQGQPSRIERDFVNPSKCPRLFASLPAHCSNSSCSALTHTIENYSVRLVGLSMPEDYADRIRESQFDFERAVGKLNKATAGIKRDLSVEIDPSAVSNAKAAWEEGRVAINSFFLTVNEATGLKDEMKVIPPPGPNQLKEYGRSIRRYNELMKKTKLCQNRGGPQLANTWGQLMISGYMQDSCGIEPLEGYFFQ